MRHLITFLMILGFSGTALAADSAYYIGVRSGADLLSAPASNAKVVKHLPWKTSVRIIQKQRNWRKVETVNGKKLSGWIVTGAIRKRYQAATTAKKSSFLSGFSSLFRSPEPAQKTAVLGVRGLEDEGAAKSGRTTEQANRVVKWMDTLNVPAREVSAFIDEGELNP